jgi:gas vesicle protein
MENDVTTNVAGSFGAFIAGLGVGALIGILFAPKSGVETRDYISRKADEGVDYVQGKSREMRDRAEDLVEQGKRAVSRQAESVSQAVDAGREAYRSEMSH